jgi:pSer/pThr/pTyr-binding forkhead associated (FHA) protein/tetratricopeptide (TPR) repeat protein
MSAVLEVYQSKQKVAAHPLGAERFLIGRSKECALTIDEDQVSRKHTAIHWDNGTYWVEDLGSRNGTKVNGQKLAKRHRLQSGDTVVIGSQEMIFRLAEDTDGDGGVTVVHAGPEPELSPSQKVAKKSSVGRWAVRLKIVEGYLKGETFENWEGTLRIGRGKACNVPLLSDEYISLNHAEVVAEGDQYFLVDLDSDNGTFLDARRVPPRQRTPLVHGAKIRAGKSSVLVFERVDTEKQRQTRHRLLLYSGAAVVLFAVATFFRPPDIAADHFAAAEVELRKDNLTVALQECEVVLKVDQRHRGALALKREIEARMRAADFLVRAQQHAQNGKIAEALDLCGEILRLVPKHSRTLELKSVLDAIKLANDAMLARNWPGAIQELEAANARFQGSEVIAQMLKTARLEQQAQKDLTQARAYFEQHQQSKAEEFASGIPSNSVYQIDAAGLLGRISVARETGGSVQAALIAYRQKGNLDEAREAVERGLARTPEESSLLRLQTQIREMAKLLPSLDQADRLTNTNAVDELLAGVRGCDSVLRLENDPLSFIGKRSTAIRLRLREWLAAVAQSFASQGAKSNEARDDKEAFRLFLSAVTADPTLSSAQQGLEATRSKILSECKEAYLEGYSNEGFKNLAKAREFYTQAIRKGLPNLAPSPDDYYEKAVRRLQALGSL